MSINNIGTPGIDPQVETWATSAARADAIEARVSEMLEDVEMWIQSWLCDVPNDTIRSSIARTMARRCLKLNTKRGLLKYPKWYTEARADMRDAAADEVDDEWKRAGGDVEGWG